MGDAVIFNSSSQLEFQEVRMNVSRIPEVIARVREAQDAWERTVGGDLASFLLSEDERFASGPRRRQVAVGVVQIALFDHYHRSHGLPEYLAGPTNGPIGIVLGMRTLAEFITETARATRILANVAPTWFAMGPATRYEVISTASARPARVVTIGPGGAKPDGAIDSVDLDPALDWFWTSLTGNRMAIAN